ncbi:MAG: apolipoprotein N-acyltransferase [Bacteroidales bacterium]|nr:apolipoprotein N-acyltransferase [Bacteroidales bacterium]
MTKEQKQMTLLSAISAVMLSIPYLIPHTGIISLFALVPLLAMERIATLSGTKKLWRWHYPTFVLWNALTTFWVCNATIGGGVFAVLANAFQMSVVFGLFRLSRKAFKGVLPYIFLATAWIAWERAYFSAEISWPWLVLGNSFARTLSLAQWYEYVGTIGGSVWIWACNLGLFGIMCALSDGSWTGKWNIKAKIGAAVSYAIVLLTPIVTSLVLWYSYEEKGTPLEVLITQPNFDPYHKFQALSQDQQNAVLEGLIRDNLKDRKDNPSPEPLLVLAPETFTSDVNLDLVQMGRTVRRMAGILTEYPNVNLLFGATTLKYTHSDKRPSDTVRDLGEGNWLQTYNSAIMTDGTARYEIFHKSKLVVGVEKTPYPKIFRPIDDMLGGVMGRDIGQDEISLLHVENNAEGRNAVSLPIGCAICYESVYGEYFTGYIKKGAKAMTVITNDAWWGDTPGYRQHLSYSSLRAIETRRDIARCANTGISAIINQKGQILESSPWWETAVIRSEINLTDGETFFVRNGDIAGRICSFMFLLLLLAMVVRLIVPSSMRRN